jgi:hypothetical protein
MDSPHDTAYAVGCPIRRPEDHRALAPPLGFSQRATSFIASRCQGIHQMPFSCCARAQPQARGDAACKDQRSEARAQMAQRPATPPALGFSDFRSPIFDLWNRCAGTAPPMLAHRLSRLRRCSRIGATHTHAQARPRPEGRSPDLLHGHDSLHDVQRTEDRDQGADQTVCRASSPSQLFWSRCQKTASKTPVFRSLPSAIRAYPRLVVGLGRFERPTSRLSGVRSDQLSYRPKIRDQRTEIRGQTRHRQHGSRRCVWSVFRSLSLSSDPEGMRGRRPEAAFADDSEPSRGRPSGLSSDLCSLSSALRKEVIQPQVPLRLPCYDFTPVADLTVDGCPLYG